MSFPLPAIAGNFVSVNSITDWLNGSHNYSLGVALYRCHGTNTDLLKMFEQGESDFRKARLLNELRIIHSNAEREPVFLAGERQKTIITPAADMPENRVPKERDPYRDEWIPLYAEMNHLRGGLELAPNDTERGIMAFRIRDIDRELNKIWHKRDYELSTGQKFQEEKQTDINQVAHDTNRLRELLSNARSNVSRTKGKLKSDPDNITLQNRLSEYQSEKLKLEKLLANE